MPFRYVRPSKSLVLTKHAFSNHLILHAIQYDFGNVMIKEIKIEAVHVVDVKGYFGSGYMYKLRSRPIVDKDP